MGISGWDFKIKTSHYMLAKSEISQLTPKQYRWKENTRGMRRNMFPEFTTYRGFDLNCLFFECLGVSVIHFWFKRLILETELTWEHLSWVKQKTTEYMMDIHSFMVINHVTREEILYSYLLHIYQPPSMCLRHTDILHPDMHLVVDTHWDKLERHVRIL